MLCEPGLHELERRLAAICPALRDEAFLPDGEYEGSHKLPVILEPLGLLSLGRREEQVDPLASMGCALLVVIVAVLILALFGIAPPWVPGTWEHLGGAGGKYRVHSVAAAAALTILWMLNSSGPQPRVVSASLEAPAAEGAIRSKP